MPNLAWLLFSGTKIIQNFPFIINLLCKRLCVQAGFEYKTVGVINDCHLKAVEDVLIAKGLKIAGKGDASQKPHYTPRFLPNKTL